MEVVYLSGPSDPFEVASELPPYILMHSGVWAWFQKFTGFTHEGRIFSVPVIIDDKQPTETTWADIIKVSRETTFVPARLLKEAHSTEDLVNVLKSRGYTVTLSR